MCVFMADPPYIVPHGPKSLHNIRFPKEGMRLSPQWLMKWITYFVLLACQITLPDLLMILDFMANMCTAAMWSSPSTLVSPYIMDI